MKRVGKSGHRPPPPSPSSSTHPAKSRTTSRKGHLTADDEALWHHAAQTIRRVRMKPRVPDTEPIAEPTRSPRRPEPVTRASARAPETPSPMPPPASGPSSSRAAKEPPPLASFEKKKARRIASGRIEIDARLDLHGDRQSEAHVRLRGFLMQCVAKGYGTVLVITGKGGPAPATGQNLTDLIDKRDRGVLRRSVPLWLEQPELRAIVVSYRSAHARHGGDGALYIELRKRRG